MKLSKKDVEFILNPCLNLFILFIFNIKLFIGLWVINIVAKYIIDLIYKNK